ncbi:hypothetical protein [Haloactinomyces albus]|uniref:Uncharacterized protein n=1 Tax=Haloactinomyces albus TaxID=1352928 RepID=A0AAE4CPI6_9ACTN|nr:hypothetical protein [Haloactinomyces albus]MDR7303117.1 hypothetical protein [Haloactinomyces albus]
MLLLRGDPLLLRGDSLFLQGDPTGLSSWAGRLVFIVILLSVLVLAVRWLWDQRKR